MVISRVVSSLIINFSPWLVCLPGAVRSVCVGAVSAAGSTHYTYCYGLFLRNVMQRQFEMRSKRSRIFPAALARCIAVRGAECRWTLGADGAPSLLQNRSSWDPADVPSVSLKGFPPLSCWELSPVTIVRFKGSIGVEVTCVKF